MSFYSRETVADVKKIDLLTYLQNYEPEELVHVSGNVYCTKAHDSLRISNGKWCWFSQGIDLKHQRRSPHDVNIKIQYRL